jgi:hypothetical protein
MPCVQFDDDETYEQYKAFFDDVLPEFEKAGKVVQFKVRQFKVVNNINYHR